MEPLIREWITNLIGVAMLGILMDTLLPNGDLKKYTRLIMGLVILSILLKPMLLIFDNIPSIESQITKHALAVDAQKIEYQSKIMEEKQLQQIKTLFQKKLESQIEKQILSIQSYPSVKAKAVFSEKDGKADYSNLKYIHVEVASKNTMSVKPVKIKINDDNEAFSDNAKEITLPNDEIDKIKNTLSDFYGIPKNKIIVKELKGD